MKILQRVYKGFCTLRRRRLVGIVVTETKTPVKEPLYKGEL
jgi:hypothetical protein